MLMALRKGPRMAGKRRCRYDHPLAGTSIRHDRIQFSHRFNSNRAVFAIALHLDYEQKCAHSGVEIGEHVDAAVVCSLPHVDSEATVE